MSLAGAPTHSAPRSAVGLLINSVFLENIRRREFYVLLLFMGLFLLGAIVVRIVGIENAATANFLLNLGLTLAFGFAKLITLLTAARQFPDEMEQRTLYPLLAKPLSRSDYIIGKWAASVLTGLVTLAVLFLMAYIPVPRLEQYSPTCLLQMLLLEVTSIAMLAALAILFSLLLPKAFNLVLLVLTVLAGGRLLALIRNRFMDSPAYDVVRWITGYFPDFSRLDLLLRYTDGLPALSAPEMLLRIFYAVAFTAFPLAIAARLLQSRPL
ncbi:MAG: ABC transporter permease subunit [Candidatus Sumerlaeaceae bacterium]